MAEPTNVVRCPFCHHPYPMTDLQREVYRGRHMGCMNCGRPFKVPEIAPPAPPRAPDAPDAPDAEAFDPAGFPGGANDLSKPFRADVAARADAGSPDAQAAAGRLANVPALVGLAMGTLFLLLMAVIVVIAVWTAEPAPGIARQDHHAAYIDVAQRGLMYLAFAAAASALLLGLIGLARSANPTIGGKGRAVAAVCLGGGGAVVVVSLLAIVMPAIDRQHQRDRRQACALQLEQIARGLNAYAIADAQSRYPDGIEALILAGHVTADTLVCPGGTDAPAGGSTRGEQAALIATESGHLSYVYLARGRTLDGTSAADTVLAHEAVGHHGGGIHVAFLDGTVAFLQGPQLDTFFAELMAGQNPSPTATAARP